MPPPLDLDSIRNSTHAAYMRAICDVCAKCDDAAPFSDRELRRTYGLPVARSSAACLVSSTEKRAVARIRPVQLDLFSAPSASVGKVRAHHAVAAPVARVAAPAASLQSGATYRYSGLVTKPCGLWRGPHPQQVPVSAQDAYQSEVWA